MSKSKRNRENKAPVNKTEDQIKAELEAQRKAEIAKKMNAQLRAARVRYVPCVTASGNKSLRTNDPVAELLEGRDVDTVYTIVEGKLGLAKGTLAAKYEKLNPGQKRMNAGNMLRNAIKRGEIELS